MSVIVYAPRALADIERLIDFLLDDEPHSAIETGEVLVRGIEILAEHPLIGRPVEEGLRELILSRGRSGYVVLYRFDVARDQVLILAIRHQREAGFYGIPEDDDGD
jgi:plasmid stabilization system protein ParE